MGIIHRDDAKPVGYSYPLPVILTSEADNYFNVTFVTNNAVTPNTVKAGVSGKSIYVTNMTLSASAANRVDLQDGAGTVFFTALLGANAPSTVSFTTPKKITASLDLMIKSATAVTLAVSVDGYIK